jgi:hypothetical protein
MQKSDGDFTLQLETCKDEGLAFSGFGSVHQGSANYGFSYWFCS